MANILTVEEVAQKLKVKPFTVREYLKKGIIPGKKIGKQWRILDSELELFFRLPVLKSKKEFSAVGLFKHTQATSCVDFSKRKSAYGILAHVEGLSSEDFARRKAEEIEFENRHWND